jgi:hypothetical protein
LVVIDKRPAGDLCRFVENSFGLATKSPSTDFFGLPRYSLGMAGKNPPARFLRPTLVTCPTFIIFAATAVDCSFLIF